MASNPLPDKELKILQAAVCVFSRKGYHASTIADIAAEAGVAAGTIYLYFEKKEDLLISLFRGLVTAYMEEAEEALAAAAPGPDRLRKLIELYLDFFARDPELARVFQFHVREMNPTIREGIRPTVRSYLGVIEDVLRAGVEGGRFDPDLDIRVARTLLFGALDASVTAWVLSERQEPLASLVDPLHDMLARALGTPGPHGDSR